MHPRSIFVAGLLLSFTSSCGAQGLLRDHSIRIGRPSAVQSVTTGRTSGAGSLPRVLAADSAGSVRRRRITAAVVGAILGGTLGAVVGNQYAAHNRWFCPPIPSGRGCDVQHDYSGRYRTIATLTGGGVGLTVGLVVVR